MSLATILELFEPVYYLSIVLGVLTIAYMIIRQNGNPSKTISWILLIILLPFIGVGLYFTFGINFRRQRLYREKKSTDKLLYHKIIENEYDHFDQVDWINKPEIRENKGLAKLLLKSSKSLFSDDNVVEVLNDGADTFNRIFEVLESAEKHIHIQYYIFEDGALADRFLEIFTRKRKQGVEVRLIYDAVGSWQLSREYKAKLDAIGVEHSEFLPVRYVQIANKINYRNHRKIVVVDSIQGFTGGINVTDKYLNGDHLGHWRDTFLYIQGNAVNGLQYLFLSDWKFARKENLFGEGYFHRSAMKSGCAVQIVGSGPDSEYAGIMQEYDSIIHSAKEYVYISNPYLIPGEVIESALITAAMRGVDVRIMIPGVSDFKIVKWSSNSFLSKLLRAGVRIYRYQDGFLHSKVMVADDMLTSIGTGNMDIRSFHLNFEVNALVYDTPTAITMKSRFIQDCEKCEEVLYEVWKTRGASERILESLSRLVSPLL